MKRTKVVLDRPEAEAAGLGLREDQAEFLYGTLRMAMTLLRDDDPRGRHFALLLVTHEGDSDDGTTVISTDVMSSMSPDALHETLRDWLARETH